MERLDRPSQRVTGFFEGLRFRTKGKQGNPRLINTLGSARDIRVYSHIMSLALESAQYFSSNVSTTEKVSLEQPNQWCLTFKQGKAVILDAHLFTLFNSGQIHVDVHRYRYIQEKGSYSTIIVPGLPLRCVISQENFVGYLNHLVQTGDPYPSVWSPAY